MLIRPVKKIRFMEVDGGKVGMKDTFTPSICLTNLTDYAVVTAQ